MKTDDFSDQIRRKLESVEPEFREKDWTRMQQALGQSTPVFAIGSKAGLMAAASLVALMAFGGVAYQQYQANQQLHAQVQLLNKTVSTLRESAKITRPNPASVPPDTVFLTRDVVRYVAVPVERKRTGEITETNLQPNTYATETPSTVNNSPSAGITSTNRNQSSVTRNGVPNSSESQSAEKQTPNFSGSTNRNNTGITGSNNGNNTGITGSDGLNNSGNSGQNGNGVPDAGGNTETNGNNAVQLSLLSSRPFRHDTLYYQEGMARTARRIRRLLGTASPSGAALAKVDINRSEPNWMTRIGLGANLGQQQWGVGLFGEIRFDNHWRLGLGITSMNLKGESFLTEIAYGQRTKQDFRRKYASGIDAKLDIINITPSGLSVQVPVRISYRFGLGNGWSLVPSAELNLSVSNREEIRYAYLRGPGKIEPVTIVRRLPQQMFHAGSAAIYLEKNWGDWALQLGPYASTPLNNVQGRLNINTQTAGATARLFYQIDWKKKR